MRSAIRRLVRVLPSAMLGAALALTAVVPAAKAAPVDAEPKPWAVGDKTMVVDEPTITTWEGVAKDDTANIGRIWTDKTVSQTDVKLPGGIEPVVKKATPTSWSACLRSHRLPTRLRPRLRCSPLDIVLVLDVSGSMDDGLRWTSLSTRRRMTAASSLCAPTYYAKNRRREVLQ